MTKNYKRRSGLLIGALLATPCTFTTNGMLLEGMGPESAGMGGVSQAVENGTAAIIENHVTAGFTHRLNAKSAVSGAISHAPEVEQTNSNTGMTSSHSQTNLQFMYSRTF